MKKILFDIISLQEFHNGGEEYVRIVLEYLQKNDKNMGDGADKLAVLNYRAAGHSLHDPAGYVQKARVGHLDDHVTGTAAPAELFYLYLIFLGDGAGDRSQNSRGARFHLGAEGYRNGLAPAAVICYSAEYPLLAVFLYRSRGETRQKRPEKLSRAAGLSAVAAGYRHVDYIAGA